MVVIRIVDKNGHAVDPKTGKLVPEVEPAEGGVLFTVPDNGRFRQRTPSEDEISN